ncbi:hypothetical protein FV139_01460 [Parahaliea maris]|uniref:Uncharacterized protein n=1 Tax=Parahaliea maris TaxID=2716870 RepID=A0A5C9A983_9GAMM|nr:hypothetical protein [Parahaliea maris]TXS96200.1 hypothetical protein FV139_01460 [Parahaliea maris]
MSNKQKHHQWKCGLAAAAVALTGSLYGSLASAGSESATPIYGVSAPVREQLLQLSKAVQAFSSHDVARAAGWSATISDCIVSPAGGMGFHVANLDELEGRPFEVSLLRPEVLMYVPMEDGSMEFLGVEYIVPYTPENASTPPQLLGQSFQYNPFLGIWALHVWTERHNPLGVFASFNPSVSCEFAESGE